MKSTPLKLLLLACFAFWATGLAQFIHERVEHGHPHAVATSAADSASAGGSAIHQQGTPGDNHDDCPTCALFASMTAESPALPAMVGLPQPCPTIVLTWDGQAPAQTFDPFLPSRGPPVVASLFCVGISA